MILEFQAINGTYIPYSNQCRKWSDKQTDRSVVKLKVADTDVGTWSMSKTWRKWMDEISIHMRHKGCTMPLYYDGDRVPHGTRPFNRQDAHELFTIKFMGVDLQGNRYSWAMDSDGGVTVAPKEVRLLAMDRVVRWTGENMVSITIPRQGDYSDYKEAQIVDSPNTKYTTVGEESDQE